MLEKSFKKENTCRACTKTDQELASLFDKQNGPDGLCYADMITECTMFTVQENDELPHLICLECIDKVRIAYVFKKQLEESQKKFLALIESIKEIQIEPVEAIFYKCSDQLKIATDNDGPKNSIKMSTRKSSKRDVSNEECSPSLSKEIKDRDHKPRRNKCPTCLKEFIRMGHLKNHLNKFHTHLETPQLETTEIVNVKCETETFATTINDYENIFKPESEAVDMNFDFGADNDDVNYLDTQSVKSFKAEIDVSDNQINAEERKKEKGQVKQEKTKKSGQTKIIHSERRFKCETCHKSFKRNSHLKQHLLCHTKLKPYECTICQKKFGRTDNLKVHMSNHGKRQFECDCCQRTFGQAYLLKRHKDQTHSEEKPFLCSVCGQRFVRNGDLAVHMRRHKGEKPFKCQYCNKGFTRSTEVYVHERYHTGEKKHVCNICGKAFQRPYNLVVHVRTHTGERPYQCPHCPKNFAQCSDLKAHIRRHTGERYKCDQCSMGFIHVFVLNQHKRNVHGNDVPPRIIRIAKLNTEIP